ncbi:flagellar motor protein MotB [Candidatus Uabimicrobium amorphum]|uniref:OmpA/MotB protein n=1 Tax=Uabimicrobium amorphum TaxID=2596890 RepID=A0A5S9F4Z9_UABAM|nr:flagellar motor protein MotB [Candidatus Uabimicrobium amorphum]BBM85024.1 OmpA/MotB protein [Candidatus Uabimicrobium amorphum]
MTNRRRPRKKIDMGGGPETPEWVVTFSDIISLLVTFFVLLLTYSAFDSKEFQLVRGSLQGSIGVLREPKRDSSSVQSRTTAFIKSPSKRHSEVPGPYQGEEGNPIQLETKVPIDETMYNKYLLLKTQIYFHRNETKLSKQSYEILDSIAEFIKHTDNEITIKCYAYPRSVKKKSQVYVVAAKRGYKIWNYFVRHKINPNRLTIASCFPTDGFLNKKKSTVDIVVWNEQPKEF